MRDICALIKPVSSACNMGCNYCFYNDIASMRATPCYGTMSCQMIEAIIKKLIKEAERSVTICFQGGEPLIIGIDFYRHVVECEKKYNTKGLQIYNSVQTNGTLITEELAVLFSQNNFLIGLSLDGPREIHETYRHLKNGESCFEKTMQGIELLKKHGVDFNILTVVSDVVAKNISRVWDFFMEKDFTYLQFITCLPLFEAERCDFMPTERQYAKYLVDVYKKWRKELNNGKYVSVRHIDNMLMALDGRQPEICARRGHCSIQLVIEADGSVYPCDFYVTEHFRLGNIIDDRINDLVMGTAAHDFIENGVAGNARCKECSAYIVCRGGCRREQASGRDMHCYALRHFFEASRDDMLSALIMLKRGI